MTTTVTDLCTQSLQRIGVLGAGETASSDDLSVCFTVLNQLMDQWATERLTIYTITRTASWAIASGVGSYAIGPSSELDIVRPVYVEAFGYTDSSVDTPVERRLRMLTDEEYSRIPMKTLTSVYPTVAYYNPTFPDATLELWPVPTSATLEGVIYVPTAVTQFDALTSTVALPPGYQRFIVTNLAVEVSPLFGAQLNQLLISGAAEARASVKRANIRLYDLDVDPGAIVQSRRYGYDIYTG